ncbi:MAG: hypothetical protein KA288_05695 [Paludibacteraceae bacterium]|jgi:hypothetical protein|nr:hypothetical protein [Paludibacteraceae bacterium]MBP9970329.1 hypothetical protein [Paludibacteraceae bacterium]
MEITSLVKNIYNRLIVFICLACIFSACVEKECITYKHVLVGIELIQDTSNTVYTADSITVKGVGSDEIIYDNAKNISSIYLPLKSVSNTTSFDIVLNETPFVLSITHQNIPQLLNIECGTVMFHKIEDATIDGEIQAVIQVENTHVQNRENEKHIYIRL